MAWPEPAMDGLPIGPDQTWQTVPGARWPAVTAGRLERRGGHMAETKGRARRLGLE